MLCRTLITLEIDVNNVKKKNLKFQKCKDPYTLLTLLMFFVFSNFFKFLNF